MIAFLYAAAFIAVCELILFAALWVKHDADERARGGRR